MLTLGAMLAAVVTCLYFFNLPPFNSAKAVDKAPAPPEPQNRPAGFGRRSR